jgi:hypothetical protein
MAWQVRHHEASPMYMALPGYATFRNTAQNVSRTTRAMCLTPPVLAVKIAKVPTPNNRWRCERSSGYPPFHLLTG